MNEYKSRVIESLLSKKLEAKGAVLIEGPKWCGKTTTAEEFAASKVLLAKADVKDHFKNLLESVLGIRSFLVANNYNPSSSSIMMQKCFKHSPTTTLQRHPCAN